MGGSTIDLTGQFVLTESAVLTPVRELPTAIRARIGTHNADDVIVSRKNSRSYSKLMNHRAASLIAQFRTPNTIARAVARCARDSSRDPEAELEVALPLLQYLIEAELLRASHCGDETSASFLLSVDDQIDAWTILQCVQRLEDTAVYRVCRDLAEYGALKIGRADRRIAARTIKWEARMLSRLDLAVTPRLLSVGSTNSGPYLVEEWIVGTDSARFCEELRKTGVERSQRALLNVTNEILSAYATLHTHGVVHGDVHSSNLMIEGEHSVKILDFGAARALGSAETSEAPRAGVSFFFEPEVAEAARAGRRLPLPTEAGEQYSLAALLYLLLTGRHYIDFVVERDEMFRQIAQKPMMPFAYWRRPAWPAAELLLSKALSKAPSERFESVAAFAQAWRRLQPPFSDAQSVVAGNSPLQAIRRDFVSAASIAGPIMRQTALYAPASSLSFGSAGIAYALYRMACSSDDAELLAAADVWSTRALSEVRTDAVFYGPDLQLDSRAVAPASVWHGPAGVFAVHALIAHARGDTLSRNRAIRRYVELCRLPSQITDLTLGYAGALLGCALLFEVVADADLRLTGNNLFDECLKAIDVTRIGPQWSDPTAFGMAHGLSGLIYAALCWSAIAGSPISGTIDRQLHELAIGSMAAPPDAPGWCNGSSGLVFLWTTAYRATDCSEYLDLAERFASRAQKTRTTVPGLCCGLAGQAYALLNAYRNLGDVVWLASAREIAREAAAAYERQRSIARADDPETRLTSLYKGGAGIAVLGADLERADEARMPMFELEG